MIDRLTKASSQAVEDPSLALVSIRPAESTLPAALANSAGDYTVLPL
jgi:hypothetical protein